MTKYALIFCLIFTSHYSHSQYNTQTNQRVIVPAFSGIDDTGKPWKSTNVKSDFLVVYFYPAAMTGGCTKQACAHRDLKASFDKLNIAVIGVSGDEVKNLQQFKETYQLNFSLLSDSSGKIAKLFGVPTKNGGSITKEINGENFLFTRGTTAERWTFILNKKQEIIYKNAQVNAVNDSQTVKQVIEDYKKK